MKYSDLISFFWQFMRKHKWIFLAILVLDSFSWSFDALIWPYILRIVIDIFSQFETNRMAAWTALKLPIIGALALEIYVVSTARIMGFLLAKALPKLQADIRMTMFDHVQHHSPHYFNERFAGTLVNKITDMTTQVETIIQQLFWPIVPALSTFILGAIFLWFVNPLFTLILFVWAIIHLWTCYKFALPCDRYEEAHGVARSTLIGKIVDSFTNNFAVNLFYRFRYEKRALQPYQDEEKSTNITARYCVEKMRCYTDAFYFLVVVVGMFGSLLYLWIHNHITTGQVVQVFTTMWSIAVILRIVGDALPLLFQSFGTVKQAYSVMQDPSDVKDTPQATELIVSTGAIDFENVTFDYGERKLFADKHVQIKGGERVGLVGYTGAGKSTFVNLILRFYPLLKGKIAIDGQDISRVTLESLRRQIALIPQDPLLFHRSLKDNIAYSKPEATDEEIIQAAKLAHCDEFIRNIPKGYAAKVGERGTKLSGGERQRIAIARALLRDAPILILDEATSSLDSVTEKFIQESLEKLMQGRTTLVIAHRLSTLARMDRILVFDQGKIVEDGRHEELLAKKGLYAKMWTMQVGGFLPDSPT